MFAKHILGKPRSSCKALSLIFLVPILLQKLLSFEAFEVQPYIF